MLGKSPIKWTQRPDMTITVDWDVKHQTNNQHLLCALYDHSGDESSMTLNKTKACFDVCFGLLLYVPINRYGRDWTCPPFYGMSIQHGDAMT